MAFYQMNLDLIAGLHRMEHFLLPSLFVLIAISSDNFGDLRVINPRLAEGEGYSVSS